MYAFYIGLTKDDPLVFFFLSESNALRRSFSSRRQRGVPLFSDGRGDVVRFFLPSFSQLQIPIPGIKRPPPFSLSTANNGIISIFSLSRDIQGVSFFPFFFPYVP